MAVEYRCSKCGGRLAKPQIEPELKPYVVAYNPKSPFFGLIEVTVYAADEEHAREIAPILTQRHQTLKIATVTRFKEV